jgi:hypothetical protein
MDNLHKQSDSSFSRVKIYGGSIVITESSIKKLGMNIFAGFLIGWLAMVGFNYVLSEYLFYSAMEERRRIKSVIQEMLNEERSK